MSADYVIGIDLGTTNSVLAFASLADDDPQIETLPIPQLTAPGTVESRTALPSFLYLATERDTEVDALALPWNGDRTEAVGLYARSQSAAVPDRTVGAAKSWLTHHGVDRHEPILPWNAPAEVPKISPVTASRRYLEHLVGAWNHSHPGAPIDRQRVVLTVPASFDASARELTREAAALAGLPADLVLIEEPQAAVYAWLADRGERWRESLGVGDRLLVVDVGGGTTDLTLISVHEADGNLTLERTAVGRHLLVGGDNMDLALAHYVAELFAAKNVTLDPWQSVSLWHACREAKEKLLADDGPETHPVSVLGRGSKLIGGTVTVDVPRDEARQRLLEGFFPKCDLGDRPAPAPMTGFQELGLPFESEPAITRHIAEFLSRQEIAETETRGPTDVLLNGGVFKSPAIADRLLTVLGDWFPNPPPERLAGDEDLDHAVARGATRYGFAKERGGVRIRGGTARSYYVGIESAGLAIPGAPRPLRALCVVPMGMEEGTETPIPGGQIGMVVGQPARFRFFSSTVRKDDQPGDLLASWSPEELIETDPLEATLDSRPGLEDTQVPVTFESRITELGVFELWSVSTDGDHRWKLEFNVREEDGDRGP